MDNAFRIYFVVWFAFYAFILVVKSLKKRTPLIKPGLKWEHFTNFDSIMLPLPRGWFIQVGWMEWQQYAGSLLTPTQLLGVAALYCWGGECPELVEGWGVNQKL